MDIQNINPQDMDLTKLAGYELMDLRETIKGKAKRNELTYDEAMALLEPVLKEQDRRAAVIAKKHNKKYSPQSRVGVLR